MQQVEDKPPEETALWAAASPNASRKAGPSVETFQVAAATPGSRGRPAANLLRALGARRAGAVSWGRTDSRPCTRTMPSREPRFLRKPAQNPPLTFSPFPAQPHLLCS